ncbi:hypothetical protein LCGC14_0768670 [marine sediment metagenome]|uniref:Uncharacterized protein n=1 Tax=marine sediment metagenome TaxID=412755 RepID=A0A0F9Q376_9ZZZZ
MSSRSNKTTVPKRRLHATAHEFAHTLRSTRPSYDATLQYVKGRIADLTDATGYKHLPRMLERYKAALVELKRQPRKFR